MCLELGIDQYDWLLIGDGSGSNYEHACGWGCVSIEQATGERRVWSGAMDHGTVNIAEIMAYIQPLVWIASQEAERREKRGVTRTRNIHIISDSEYVVKMGSQIATGNVKNAGLLTAFAAFRRQGLLLTFHWSKRSTIALNDYADRVSKLTRNLIKSNDPRTRMSANHDVDTINP